MFSLFHSFSKTFYILSNVFFSVATGLHTVTFVVDDSGQLHGRRLCRVSGFWMVFGQVRFVLLCQESNLNARLVQIR